MPVWLIPIVVLGALLLLVALVALLGRIAGGRYLRPIVALLARAPLIGRAMTRASRAALERSNPDLASALRKLERANAGRDPERAARALQQLTPAERRAYLQAAGQQGIMPTPQNREQRRRQARATKGL